MREWTGDDSRDSVDAVAKRACSTRRSNCASRPPKLTYDTDDADDADDAVAPRRLAIRAEQSEAQARSANRLTLSLRPLMRPCVIVYWARCASLASRECVVGAAIFAACVVGAGVVGMATEREQLGIDRLREIALFFIGWGSQVHTPQGVELVETARELADIIEPINESLRGTDAEALADATARAIVAYYKLKYLLRDNFPDAL